MKVRDIPALHQDFDRIWTMCGEAGLDNEVKGIDALETSYSPYWSSPNDFIVTKGYCMSNGDTTEDTSHLKMDFFAKCVLWIMEFVEKTPERYDRYLQTAAEYLSQQRGRQARYQSKNAEKARGPHRQGGAPRHEPTGKLNRPEPHESHEKNFGVK
jgi:hypothetical protein